MNTNPSLLTLDVAVLVSMVFGFCVTNALLPRQYRLLKLALTPGAGAGVCAIIYFCFRRPMFGIEAVMFVVAAALLWRQRQKPHAGFDISAQSLALLSLAMPAFLIAAQTALIHLYRRPHGDWDGWAIWNWEARLLFRAGAGWRSFLPTAFHGDYPLLVPATTARFWRYMGAELPEVGAWLGIVLGLCSIALLALTLAELRSPILGTLMGLTLLGTPNYVDASASQYADVPIGFFFLACLALIALYFERGSDPPSLRMLSAAGFFAGCAGWTKNEGLLFIIAAAAALSLPVLRERRETLRRLAYFGAGLAVPLLVIITFKLTNHVSNNVVAYEPGKLQKALMIDRHVMILKYFGRFAFSFGNWSWSPYIPVIAFILLIGVQRPVFRSYAWRTIVSIIILVSLGYYFVYLTTPLSLQWHIETSMYRLLLQLWPSLLLVAGMICRGGPKGLHNEEIG
jgi:Dolichyl-phosphate-mannose-protein mannosyltransferase